MDIKEADSVEIISLVDNSIDFLSNINQKDTRSLREWSKKRSEMPKAEHGFSMLIRIFSEGKAHSILFDTGCSSDGVIWNAECLGVNLKEVECVVLSHGHYDHFGGLLSVLKVIDKPNLPLIVHEDMFKTRGAGSQKSIHIYPDFPSKEELKTANLISTKQPQLFMNDLLLVTGEIPRETTFERGYIEHKALEGTNWKPDPWILDDRAIAIHLRGKGLVILSGCAHAGIINTVRYVQKITAVPDVYAVLGGFNLAGKGDEDRIKQTVEELQRIILSG